MNTAGNQLTVGLNQLTVGFGQGTVIILRLILIQNLIFSFEDLFLFALITS